jgi:hypothetical protein
MNDTPTKDRKAKGNALGSVRLMSDKKFRYGVRARHASAPASVDGGRSKMPLS